MKFVVDSSSVNSSYYREGGKHWKKLIYTKLVSCMTKNNSSFCIESDIPNLHIFCFLSLPSKSVKLKMKIRTKRKLVLVILRGSCISRWCSPTSPSIRSISSGSRLSPPAYTRRTSSTPASPPRYNPIQQEMKNINKFSRHQEFVLYRNNCIQHSLLTFKLS